MRTVAIIPARGGSKGIKRKNLRLLAGRPLVTHSVLAARAAVTIDRVIVSTDDPEIARVVEECGAEVSWRPPELSGDTASSESALLCVLDELTQKGEEPELVVFLQCTSPLTRAEDIDAAVHLLLEKSADSAFSASPFHGFLWRQDSDEAIAVNHDKRSRPRRQDLSPQFRENGAIYVMRTRGFRQTKHRFFGKTVLYAMSPLFSIDIDEPEDLSIAEALLMGHQRSERLRALPSNIGGLVFDFDGVFTDNQLIVWEDGREGVICSRSDGWGLSQIKRTGLPLLVLSTEVNSVVSSRCRKLGIECIQGAEDKLVLLKSWALQNGLALADILYVGNDVNDLPCLEAVGFPVVVADAHPAVRSVAKLILSAKGGKGALRELTELVLERWKESRNG